MPTYQADAIVLHRLDYGDADRILTLLTREHGKLAAIAKGARRSKTRVGSSLDLFGRSRMMLAKGKNLDVVAQVERRGDVRNIAGDLRRTAYACLVSEIADKVLEDRHPMDDVFELVAGTLDRLNDSARSARADTAWFVMRMLDLLGYAPQLLDCAGCSKPLPEAEAWFSPLLGGVLCEKCGGHDQSGSPVSVNSLKVLRVMAGDQGELYDRLRLPDLVIDQVEQALESQLEYHLDRRLKSLDFIRSVQANPPPRPSPARGEGGFRSEPPPRPSPAGGEGDLMATPQPSPPPQGGREVMEKLVSLAKRRGFFFQSSEIYGGIQGVMDFGPLGVALRHNLKRAWWRSMVELRDDVVGIDAGIIMNPKVWEASGHVQNFTDPLVECKKCHQRFRADQVSGPRHEDDGGEFTEARQFNLMFKTFVGPMENSSTQAYLRPETAQGIFVNFANILNSSHMRPPFGIAQIGKAFRNEITPGNSIFRLREFEQMELEFFVPPAEEMTWLDFWKEERLKWYLGLGIHPERLRLREHGKDELAHYARGAFDVEYEFPFGWSELEGIAARGDYDLAAHQRASGRDLSYFDDIRRERYLPHVVEPSAGVDRSMLTLMIDAYHEEEVRGEQRVVMRFHPSMAPIEVAVLPLSRKEPLTALATKVEHELRPHFRTEYDDTQSIGKRYRRQDEIGTPFAVTIDFETVNDQAATIRSRDEMTQVRVPLAELRPELQARLR